MVTNVSSSVISKSLFQIATPLFSGFFKAGGKKRSDKKKKKALVHWNAVKTRMQRCSFVRVNSGHLFSIGVDVACQTAVCYHQEGANTHLIIQPRIALCGQLSSLIATRHSYWAPI